MMRASAPLLPVLVLACAPGTDQPLPTSWAGRMARPDKGMLERGGELRRGVAPPAHLARRPRFRPAPASQGVRALPDGDLREWEAAGSRWVELRPVAGAAAAHPGAKDLSGRLALASYGSGVSLALQVRDGSHRPARVAAALARSDHVEVELWPGGRPPPSSPRLRDRAVGVRLRLGSLRGLVEVLHPLEAWRSAAVSSFGAERSEGYQLEARLPLSALTPLPAPRVERLDYRVTVHDVDEGGGAAVPTLRAAGSLRLDPALEVPEAVQLRPSVRACMAGEPDALWGFENGWRCSVPYLDSGAMADDDALPQSELRLGHSLLLEPPTLVWIRERVIFVNLTGVNRGVAALFDKKDTLLSVLPLGVVGALDPGSTSARNSDAEPVRLPDGTWAVAVTHAYPAASVVPGGRCAAGHRVFLSIIALRGCLTSTPQAPAPEPPEPPYLEEVFGVSLEDCATTSASDWELSKDHTTITVRSSIEPTRPPRVYRYLMGRYRLVEG